MPQTSYTRSLAQYAFIAMLVGLPCLCAYAAPRPQQLPDYPLLWPATISPSVAMSDGVNDIAVGDELAVHSLQRDGVVVKLTSGDLTLLPFDRTDIAARAQAIEESLPEDLRGFKATDLPSRPDLFPERVTLTEEIQMGDGSSIPAGTDIGPYRVIVSGRSVLVAALPLDRLAKGTLHQRNSYPIETTDLWPQLREKLASKQYVDTPQVVRELSGHLVDANGQAYAFSDNAKYIVVYSAAGWCGYCKQFNPTMIKTFEKVKAEHPEVEFVLMSNDHSEEDMYATMKSEGMPWPALAYDQRLQSRFLIGQISGGTPEVIVMTREGRLIHDGQPGGIRGGEAAIRSLQRELSR